MWIKKITETHIFNFLFIIAISILITIFVLNILFGSKGTYYDHSDMMWTLFNKKYNKNSRNNNFHAHINRPSDLFDDTEENEHDKKVSFESKGETECRRAIEFITGKPFPRSRPSFLRNKVSGHCLELDCFNDDLKLAIEYNGKQHYKYIPYFHSNKESFYNNKYRDEMKKQLCKDAGIKLIIVPYTVKTKDIEKYIENEMNQLI